MPINRRVFKLLLQLDNTNDNLILMAARKLVSDLKAGGSDLRTLANALEAEWERQASGEQQQPPPRPPPNNGQRGIRLTDDEYAELVDIFETVDARRISAASQKFMSDMAERHEQYGRRIFVSPRQWEWLRSLRDEF